jgi:hypothetical protein
MRTIPGGPMLVKYGQRNHMELLQKEGQVYFCVASEFQKDPSQARRDDELSKTAYGRPSAPIVVSVVGGSGPALPLEGLLSFSTSFPVPPHLLFCASASYQHRMFDDFRCDACLIIHKPLQFLELLDVGVSNQMPGWRLDHGPVEYYDERDGTGLSTLAKSWRNDQLPVKRKAVRLAYQREYRCALLPPRDNTVLSSSSVAIGSIEAFSELFVL